MGIPFYFASLVRAHPGITRPVTSLLDVDVFAIDFNCLIHQYLKADDPVKSVTDALEFILLHICTGARIYVAFDGLVPYAKIVQQRYRRFRTKEEDVFDKNQISPDTPYMRKLEQAVKARFPYVHVSTTQTPGEGEHKIFQELKKIPADQRQTVCIYGLDADLILLSLANHAISPNLILLRESGEFKDDSLKSKSIFSALDIHKLLCHVPVPIDQYVVLCILCFGNDFMPNLGIFSLREGGYARALEYYIKSGKPDITTEAGRAVFLDYSASKETSVLVERVRMRRCLFERCVVGRNADCISRKYGLHILDGVLNMEPVVDAFWKTFHWTLRYFQTNKPYNWDWVYPYADAPLLEDIVQVYETDVCANPVNYTIQNQLQLILPSTSLHTAKRKCIYANEYYTKTREPWMKRYDWEMKPRISIPWNPTALLTSVCRF